MVVVVNVVYFKLFTTNILLYSTLLVLVQVSIVSTDFHKIFLQVVSSKQDMGLPVSQLPGFRTQGWFPQPLDTHVSSRPGNSNFWLHWKHLSFSVFGNTRFQKRKKTIFSCIVNNLKLTLSGVFYDFGTYDVTGFVYMAASNESKNSVYSIVLVYTMVGYHTLLVVLTGG